MNMGLDSLLHCLAGETWSSQRLINNLEEFTMNIGPRFAGTSAEKVAAEFICQQFQESGLENVFIQPFSYTGWTDSWGRLFSGSQDFPVIVLPLSPVGKVTAPLVYLGYGLKDDYQVEVRGKIVMANSDTPPHMKRMAHQSEKYDLAVNREAAGFVFMNHFPGNLPVTGTVRFGEIGPIPAVGLSNETGRRLIFHLKQDRMVTLEVEANIQALSSQNVIGWAIPETGTKTGAPLVIGAHYDSHSLSPGAVDNAVAVSILIELAAVFNRLRPYLNTSVVFIAFGAEEIGLLGSRRLLEEDWVNNVEFMANIDGIGSSPEIEFNTQGYSPLRDRLDRIAAQFKLEVKIENHAWPYSDHWPFAAKGIPSFQIRPRKGDLSRGWGHTPADTLDKIRIYDLRANAFLITQFITRLGLQTGGSQHETL